MTETDFAYHYVCTSNTALQLVEEHSRFWISRCECREKRGKCGRSRSDVCVYFRNDIEYFGTDFHEVSRAAVAEILQEAQKKHLVARPFRYESIDRTDGICFCCDDCCEYFLHPDQTRCDKGRFIEKTDGEKCADCGTCVAVCYFRVRKVNGELAVERENCYGCGLCVEVCPENCIQMVERC